MNTEEKAKAYDEALNWMREIYPELHGATKEDAEHFFPELAESDDERVRKSIIHILQVGGYMSPEEKDKAFAYLEKQKEQKPLTTEETELNSIAFLEQMGYTCIPPGKEQKPAEKQDYSGLNDLERAILRGFLSAGVENVPVTVIKETAKECLAQMKPVEWSDEDKAIVGCIACCLDGQFVTEVARKQCLEWFNKHRRDFLNAHHTEWSEEDEEISKRIISDLRWGRRNSVSDKDIRQYDEEINWMENKLKSLLLQGSKDSLQTHWKPSNEQMEAIKHAYNSFPNDCSTKSNLMFLYRDLMKLM